MYREQCSKCGGSGRIKMFNHVMGGVCFACNGRGVKFYKSAPKKLPKFAVGAVARADNKPTFPIFYIKAKNAEAAREKATRCISNGNGYFAHTVWIEEAPA